MATEYPSSPSSGNHLLYPFVSLMFYRLWMVLGWHGGALFPLQVFSQLFGAAAVMTMYLIALRITSRVAPSLWIAIGFGLSAGVWAYSVDAESVTMPLALGLTFLYALLRDDNPRSIRSPLILGFICALSVVTYLTGVFLIAVGVVGYLLNPELSRKQGIRQAAVFAVAVSGATAVALVGVAVLFRGVRDMQGFLDWMFAYSSFGVWGKPSLEGTGSSVIALLRTFALFPGLVTVAPGVVVWFTAASPAAKGAAVASLAFVVLVVVTPLIAAFRLRATIMRDHHRTLAMITVWAVLYGLFAWFWVQGDVSFWVPVAAMWWVLVAIVVSARDVATPETRRTPAPWRPGQLLPVAVAVMAVVNLFATVIPNSRTDCSQQLADVLREKTGPDDLIIDSGADLVSTQSVIYFSGRKTIVVYNWIVGFLGVPSNPLLVPNPSNIGKVKRPTKNELFDEIDHAIRETRTQGRNVYVIGPNNERTDRWVDFARTTNFTKKDYDRFVGEKVASACGQDLMRMK